MSDERKYNYNKTAKSLIARKATKDNYVECFNYKKCGKGVTYRRYYYCLSTYNGNDYCIGCLRKEQKMEKDNERTQFTYGEEFIQKGVEETLKNKELLKICKKLQKT